ncbi:hypothetical protein SLEP1_g57564 [Rubroshorea leprosula]|uniref:Protein kinase domain-containing protein n=1 Tax=Rubroshorea leprosula TaxID=152421 RepID=A0AAV5MMV6_9ROSI|nr:hypothetical protein SLEP1_g57564 [Rubroshorea leprosula]
MQMKLLLWMVVMMVILPSSTVTASSNISLETCPQTCGNVSVPFPFGFGRPECAKNSTFLLTCNQSGSLLYGDIPIDNISLEDGTITGLIYPAYECYDQNGLKNGTDRLIWLSRPSLIISPIHNKFIGLGCDTIAKMTDREGRSGSGCITFCNNPADIRKDSSCSGFGCCQTSIPEHLDQVNFTVTSSSNHTDVLDFNPCSYAFIVANSFDISKLDFLGPQETFPSWLPVVFEWVIGDNRGCQDYCGPNAKCSYADTVGGFRCWCKPGFIGNPYLPLGCQDIDECKEPNKYPCLGTCWNTIGSYTCENKTNKTTWPIILGISLGFTVVCVVIGAWWLSKILKKRRKVKLRSQFFKQNGGLLLQQQLSSTEGNVEKTKIFSTKELERATDNFNRNRILGQGGQGTVYKGMLVDGRIVAVKKSKVPDKEKVKDFINEVVILTQINHRNIVKLLGCCLETEVPLLVYEFIPNGTLFQYIHGQNEEFSLSWERRLTIASEVASALSYLHSATSIPIYHRDVKSSNILLDEKYRVKVSDFGASRSIAIDQTHLTTNVQGTFGYLDPEYYQSGQFTEKSDVYSFGVVLVELLTGEKPIFLERTKGGRSLASHFILSMEDNSLFNILDARVKDSSAHEEIMKVAKLAYRCLSLSGKKRPRMIEIAVELEQICFLQNSSNDQKIHEEIRYVETKVTNYGDFASGGALSIDMEPPFSSESWGLLEKQLGSNVE